MESLKNLGFRFIEMVGDTMLDLFTHREGTRIVEIVQKMGSWFHLRIRS